MAEYDAVIVLSYKYNNGVITPQSRNRVDLGLKLNSKFGADSLCFAGRAAKSMGDYAREKGFDGRVLLEDSSRDTVGNAVFTKLEFAWNEGWKDLLVISSDYHIQRVQEIFRFVYGPSFNLNFFGSGGDFPSPNEKSEEEKLENFLNFFKGIKSGDNEAIVYRIAESHELYKNRPQLKATLMRQL